MARVDETATHLIGTETLQKDSLGDWLEAVAEKESLWQMAESMPVSSLWKKDLVSDPTIRTTHIQ